MILNPRGGGGRAAGVVRRAGPVLEAAGLTLDVRETRCAGHARELARSLGTSGEGAGAEPADPPHAVVVAGGDGTIHEVVDGLMARDDPAAVPLGVLPGGSGNSLAHDLEATDPEAAARRIVAGAPAPFDVLAVTGPGGTLHAFNIVGWGLAMDAGRLGERLRFLGAARYTVASALSVARGRRRPARLTLDGDHESGDFSFVLACNTRHTGTGMQIAPRARLDDGLLDLVIVRATSRLALLALLSRMGSARHLRSPRVRYEQVESFALAPAVDEPLNVDGEITGRTPLQVSVVPGALRLIR